MQVWVQVQRCRERRRSQRQARLGAGVPETSRGDAGQLAITSGILASSLVDYGLASSQNWRLMFGWPRSRQS